MSFYVNSNNPFGVNNISTDSSLNTTLYYLYNNSFRYARCDCGRAHCYFTHGMTVFLHKIYGEIL